MADASAPRDVHSTPLDWRQLARTCELDITADSPLLEAHDAPDRQRPSASLCTDAPPSHAPTSHLCALDEAALVFPAVGSARLSGAARRLPRGVVPNSDHDSTSSDHDSTSVHSNTSVHGNTSVRGSASLHRSAHARSGSRPTLVGVCVSGEFRALDRAQASWSRHVTAAFGGVHVSPLGRELGSFAAAPLTGWRSRPDAISRCVRRCTFIILACRRRRELSTATTTGRPFPS